MKRRAISALIVVWMAELLLLTAFPVFTPAFAEEGKSVLGSIKPARSERDLAANSSATDLQSDHGGGRVRMDSALKFETGTRPSPTPPEREAEALRFHQNTLLDRFGNSDSHGQVFLSFSGDRVDLNLRSITGVEAPVAEIRSSKK